MLFKKKDKESKPKKEKKVPVMKVGTHKKTVIALWLVLIASVSFGVYKNFTAIDMHTVHEKEVIEQRIVDTNKIENFVKAFAKSYYSWSNTQESIEKRTAAINQYLTKSLQDLNVDTVRMDIPTSSTVTDVEIWEVEAAGMNDFTVVYSVDQTVTEGETVFFWSFSPNQKQAGKKRLLIHSINEQGHKILVNLGAALCFQYSSNSVGQSQSLLPLVHG